MKRYIKAASSMQQRHDEFVKRIQDETEKSRIYKIFPSWVGNPVVCKGYNYLPDGEDYPDDPIVSIFSNSNIKIPRLRTMSFDLYLSDLNDEKSVQVLRNVVNAIKYVDSRLPDFFLEVKCYEPYNVEMRFPWESLTFEISGANRPNFPEIMRNESLKFYDKFKAKKTEEEGIQKQQAASMKKFSNRVRYTKDGRPLPSARDIEYARKDAEAELETYLEARGIENFSLTNRHRSSKIDPDFPVYYYDLIVDGENVGQFPVPLINVGDGDDPEWDLEFNQYDRTDDISFVLSDLLGPAE